MVEVLWLQLITDFQLSHCCTSMQQRPQYVQQDKNFNYRIRLIKRKVPNKRFLSYFSRKLGDQQAPKIFSLC